MIRDGNSPFDGVWDVRLLIQEIEEKLNAKVIDIPVVDKSSNSYVGLYRYAPQSEHFEEVKSHDCIGFRPENLERTGHGGSPGSWRCQHA